MSKINLDKYYTDNELAKYCVTKTFEIVGSKWSRIIEPSAGGGSFLKYFPEDVEVLAYDIAPEADGIIKQDYLELHLDWQPDSITIGNPPFGRANKLSVKFIHKSMEHSDYVSFIQPISQLNNNSVADVDLIYSEDLGETLYSGRPIHCCLNIYKKNLDHKKQVFTIPGLIECRHIFRTGKSKHPDNLLNANWDFRVAAWGVIKLLEDNETCTNEVVLKCSDSIKNWLREKLENCDYNRLISCVSSPNLPSWRLRKWLYEEWQKENSLF